MTARLSLFQVIVIVIAVLTLMQVGKQLGRWGFARYRQWDASHRLKKMGKSEYKRLERKMEKLQHEVTDLQVLQSSEIEDWILAHATVEPLNLCGHVLLFHIIWKLYSATLGRLIRIKRFQKRSNE
jgi:hypothetical protein